jgi:hypothetical protein
MRPEEIRRRLSPEKLANSLCAPCEERSGLSTRAASF